MGQLHRALPTTTRAPKLRARARIVSASIIFCGRRSSRASESESHSSRPLGIDPNVANSKHPRHSTPQLFF